jgi:nitrogen-specific signal transduction histidine kinase
MEPNDEETLPALHLNFIGKTLSVFTHEVKNHLAILRESVGLIGDLAEMGKLSSKAEIADSLQVIQAIDNQIGKTSWLCTQLNRFAHRMDKPFSTFNVNEALEELSELLHRLANQKRIAFQKDFDKDIPPVYGSPAQLELLVFRIIDQHMLRLPGGGAIVFKTGHTKDSIKINIIAEGNLLEYNEEVISHDDICEHIVRRLGGDISTAAGDGKVSITIPLSFPESGGEFDLKKTKSS